MMVFLILSTFCFFRKSLSGFNFFFRMIIILLRKVYSEREHKCFVFSVRNLYISSTCVILSFRCSISVFVLFIKVIAMT